MSPIDLSEFSLVENRKNAPRKPTLQTFREPFVNVAVTAVVGANQNTTFRMIVRIPPQVQKMLEDVDTTKPISAKVMNKGDVVALVLQEYKEADLDGSYPLRRQNDNHSYYTAFACTELESEKFRTEFKTKRCVIEVHKNIITFSI